ncbi:MAG: hypothetical protein ACYC96_06870 [Fimbriimonadaceae bacterium]
MLRSSLVFGVGLWAASALAQPIDPAYSAFSVADISGLTFNEQLLTPDQLQVTITESVGGAATYNNGGAHTIDSFEGLWLLDQNNQLIDTDLPAGINLGTPTGDVELADWDYDVNKQGGQSTSGFSSSVSEDRVMFATPGSWTFVFNATTNTGQTAFPSVYDLGMHLTFADKVIDANGDGGTSKTQFVAPSGTPEPFTIGLGIAGLGIAVRRFRAKRQLTD